MRHFTFEIYSDETLEKAVQHMEDEQLDHDSFLVCHLFCGGFNSVQCLKIVQKIDDRIKKKMVIAGIASNAEFLDGRVTDPIPVLSVLSFDESEADLLFVHDIRESGQKTGREFAEKINSGENVKAVELLVCNSGNEILDFLHEFETCSRNIPIFGGMPFGHDMLNDPRYIVTSKDISEKGAAVIIYKGENLHVNADYTSGWKPLGKKLKVTKAENCTIHEINGEPAINIYKKYLGMDASDNFMENTSEFPFLVKKSGGHMLRHPETTDEDGSINLDGYVETGMTARISYGDPETIVKDIDQRCADLAAFSPEATLIYSCAARKLFWGPFINNEIAPFHKLAPMAGFCTGGEISRDKETGEIMWHNITVVSVGFREGGKKREVKPPKVEMGEVHGQTALVRRLMTLVKETTRELEEMAIKDGLTGLFNRRETERRIDETVGQSRPTSFIMVDIDHFKSVNDTYGHNMGDVVLKRVAAELKSTADRSNGFAGRWGGEEFFLVLSGADEKQAFSCAEELRKQVADIEFPEVGHVTMSLGVITVNEKVEWDREKKEIYTAVDNALYEAKNSGRNRTVSCSDGTAFL